MASLDIQLASKNAHIPSAEKLEQWLSATVPAEKNVSLRIVDSDEIQTLNAQYRNMDKPTNVLSFPCDLPDDIDLPLLGDIVICADVVEREALEFNKPYEAHWAHMLVHGSLHLLGYDHIEDEEAVRMENLETKILTELGFPEPYVPQQMQQDCGE